MSLFLAEGGPLSATAALTPVVLTANIDGATYLSSQWGLPVHVRDGEGVAGRVLAPVPVSLEEFPNWCFIDRDPNYPDPKRDRYLAYRSEDHLSIEEVTLSFQGFVKKRGLSAYGNWNG